MTEYYIPTREGVGELVEKRSRFLGHVWRVSSEEEAREKIEATKKKHYDARHNCWCYIIKDGPVRYSDDGEPQGTAGQPMLNVFQREGVGAGGLVRAYTQSAKDALDAAGISVVRRWVAMEVPCTYAQFEQARRTVEAFSGVVEQVDYGADVVLSALLPEERAAEFSAHILDASAGTIEVLEAGERFQDVPLRGPLGE